MILDTNHFGISVNNLDEWVDFFCEFLNLRCTQRRRISDKYVSSLVAEDDASAEIALLETQDGDYIELVQWMHRGKTIFPQLDKANVVGLGQAHLCLNVRNIEKVIETALLSDMARLISKEITVVTSGPNVGAKVAFLEVGTFLYLELFERTSI